MGCQIDGSGGIRFNKFGSVFVFLGGIQFDTFGSVEVFQGDGVQFDWFGSLMSFSQWMGFSSID